MRVVFMGTPDFAVPSLRALAAAHEVTLVLTRPDAVRGRGRKLVPSPVEAAATELDLPVCEATRITDEVFSALEDARPEDLPFRDYVPNLTYTVRNANTGETVAEKTLFDVPEDITTYEILLPEDLPFGNYVVDVWGGISDDEPLAANGLPLHPDGIVGGDPYHVHQSLTYDYRHASYTLEMERVKGKLIIETEHLPTVATQSDNSITQIRTLCAPDFVVFTFQHLTA